MDGYVESCQVHDYMYIRMYVYCLKLPYRIRFYYTAVSFSEVEVVEELLNLMS